MTELFNSLVSFPILVVDSLYFVILDCKLLMWLTADVARA